MAIEKLTEFAKTGQKNTDDLDLETGFIVNRKPARQWFNWLFNTLTLKINEIIDADFMPKSDIVDNLTTNDATKPVSAKQAKVLQDNKLGKTETAAAATKLENARTISFSGAATGSCNFDGSSNASAILTLENSGVAASTYGSNLKIPVITVNGKGLITGVSEQNIPSASTTRAGIVQLNNTLTSTATNQALTAAQGKALLDMFANNISANGWQKIANPNNPSQPIILQWSTFNSSTTQNKTTMNFPIAFPNSCLFAIANDCAGGINFVGYSATKTSATFTTANASQIGAGSPYTAFAIGY